MHRRDDVARRRHDSEVAVVADRAHDRHRWAHRPVLRPHRRDRARGPARLRGLDHAGHRRCRPSPSSSSRWSRHHARPGALRRWSRTLGPRQGGRADVGCRDLLPAGRARAASAGPRHHRRPSSCSSTLPLPTLLDAPRRPPAPSCCRRTPLSGSSSSSSSRDYPGAVGARGHRRRRVALTLQALMGGVGSSAPIPGVEAVAVAHARGRPPARRPSGCRCPPTSARPRGLSATVRPPAGSLRDVGRPGRRPGQIDFLDSMGARAPYAVGLVALGTLVLLFLMTGSLVIPVKALLHERHLPRGRRSGVVVLDLPGRATSRGCMGFTSVGGIESWCRPGPRVRLRAGDGLRGVPARAHRRVPRQGAERPRPSRSGCSAPAGSSPPRRCSSSSSSGASRRGSCSIIKETGFALAPPSPSTPRSCACCSCRRR